MGSIPVANPASKRRSGATRRGVVVVVAAVVVIALIGLLAAVRIMTWSSPMWVDAGAVEDIAVNSPVRFPQHGFYLVKLDSGEVLALYDVDPRSGTVSWDADYTLGLGTGWFRDSEFTSAYDLTGRCFQGPCPRSLDRLPVRIEEGRVQVHVASDPEAGPQRGPRSTPVNP